MTVRRVPGGRALVAVLAVVGLAALLVGVGLRTIWLPDDTVTATASLDQPGVVVTTAPGLLEARPGPVTVTARASDGGPVLLAVGRQRDVEGYAEGLAGVTLTGFERDNPARLTSSVAEATPPAEGQPALADPAMSDLWVQGQTGTGTARLEYDPPDGAWLVLAAGNGTSPAPDSVTLTWPQEATTPWSTPLILVGGLVLLVSAGAAVLMFRSGRRSPGESS